jgi:serine/threonine protein kinase
MNPNLQTTVLDEAPPPVPSDIDHQRLVENYRALIREQAIRYPVPYRLVRELGRGRQGIVFHAVRQGGRGCVTRHAVKLFDPAIYSSSERYWTDMGRISSQVSQLQPMHVDALVSPDTYDECNGVGYIQMAALDGVDLEYLLEGTHMAIARSQSSDTEWDHFMDVLFRTDGHAVRLQPGIALYILRRVLIGIQVIHEARFLHGDIKPSNIMIDRLGSVRLVDFGRAVVIGERISILLGSPFYMAPEVHRGEPAPIQSDLYSAGLVGIEMLGGQFPAAATGQSEADLLDFKFKLVARIEAMLPAYVRENKLLVRILKRLLDPDAARRFPSAALAEDSPEGMSAVHRQLSTLHLDAEYDRELARYLDKLASPSTGHINPRL